VRSFVGLLSDDVKVHMINEGIESPERTQGTKTREQLSRVEENKGKYVLKGGRRGRDGLRKIMRKRSTRMLFLRTRRPIIMMTVEEIMTVEPITLGIDGTLEDARNLMTQHRIRHIPIVDGENRLLGLLTQRDLLAATIALPNAEESSVHKYESSVSVKEVMRDKVDSIEESMELRSVAVKMQQTKIGCMPVLRDGTLVGIITDSDYVSLAINLLEQLDSLDPPEFDDISDDDDM